MIKTISVKYLAPLAPKVTVNICQCFGMATKAQTSKLGNAIKRLNRENKALFGPLISRDGKTKGNSKSQTIKEVNTSSESLHLDGIQFEQNWQKSNQSCSPEMKNHRIPLRIPNEVASNFIQSTAVIPPDIIVRNVVTFPLLNVQKAADNWRSDVFSLPRESSDNLSLPSVTRVLNATMSENSRAALARWKQNMIAELGEEGFDEYSRRLLSDGREFHSLLESHLATPDQPLDVTQAVAGCWQSLQPIINDVTNVRAVESHVVHDQLKYHGVIDCIAEYRGLPAVIEWKKSDKQKPFLESTYDAPLQAAAYLGAANFDNNYCYPLRSGVVVVAYTDGAPAHVFKMTSAVCERFWGLWLQRLQQYWQQQHHLVATGSQDNVPC